MLLRLAAERATGALQREPGTLHLVDGQVVHAESPRSPGLDTLLIAQGRLSQADWDEARAGAGDPHRAAEHLVKNGRLSLGELELCRLSALFDAAYFALAPHGGPTRFRHGTARAGDRPWSVAVQRVIGESLRRRRLLDGLWPGPHLDDRPLVRRPPAAGQCVPGRLRAVLALADGSRTPTDIAGALGRPAFHVLLEVRRLAVAGLIDPCLPPDPPTGRGDPPSRSLTARPRAPDLVPDDVYAPDIALLRRVRDALEARL
ncbi:transcriptional regulator [Streptomyces sp. NBC_01304]|uniref:transcriptional regulator n=1 Tax=Streptomyces sp. NBC_01304 TaxID=2903818 RepID=UPI002E0F313D|nr:transcriptional regulator [Streptomyces sp. NBC_01304]